MIRVIFLLSWIALCFAGKWTEWQDATLCTAKPCGCIGDTTTCKDGSKIQFRYCEHSDGEDITPCAYDTHGPIQRIHCKAQPGEGCPGWSVWRCKKADCKCECEPYEKEGAKQNTRQCNKPAPVYGDQLCRTTDGISEMEETQTVRCDCPNILTTTTTEKPLDQRQCCCEIEGYNDPSESEEKRGVLGLGRRRRQAEESPDYCITLVEDPDCCKDQPEKSKEEPTYENYGL